MNSSASPRIAAAAMFGVLAAVPVAMVYGILADPFGLGLGLVVVGGVGGAIIGAAVAYGWWRGAAHEPARNPRWLALAIAVGTWLAASAIAYIGSQVFFQGATTPLADRLSLGGYVEYFGATLVSPSLLGLAAMAFLALRGAR